jgi:hypothetical protein
MYANVDAKRYWQLAAILDAFKADPTQGAAAMDLGDVGWKRFADKFPMAPIEEARDSDDSRPSAPVVESWFGEMLARFAAEDLPPTVAHAADRHWHESVWQLGPSDEPLRASDEPGRALFIYAVESKRLWKQFVWTSGRWAESRPTGPGPDSEPAGSVPGDPRSRSGLA